MRKPRMNAMVTLDKEFVVRLLRKLSNSSDLGPRGEAWQSDELRELVGQLESAVKGEIVSRQFERQNIQFV